MTFEEIKRKREEQEQIEKERSPEEWTLREILWLHHGCDQAMLYGDDGEMQCAAQKHIPFWVDFRRDPAELIKWKLASVEYKNMFEMPLDGKPPKMREIAKKLETSKETE